MSNEAINVFQQFLDSNGLPLNGGAITFYENETTTLATIYADSDLTIPQTNPYTLDALGRIAGDVHFDATLTMKVEDSNGVFIRSLDDQVSLEAPEVEADIEYIRQNGVLVWEATLTYRKGVAVIYAGDTKYYRSLIDNNTGNSPPTSGTDWVHISIVYGDIYGTQLVGSFPSPETQNAVQAKFLSDTITNIEGNVSTNTTNIGTNTGNIATNTANITDQLALSPRAWVKFQATNPPTILQSYNVTSVSWTSQGRFFVTITNALPSSTISVLGALSYTNIATPGVTFAYRVNGVSTTTFEIYTYNNGIDYNPNVPLMLTVYSV